MYQDTNFWGSVYTTRAALPYLRQSNGKIVAMSSSAAWLTAPRMSFYNVSYDINTFLMISKAALPDVLVIIPTLIVRNCYVIMLTRLAKPLC